MPTYVYKFIDSGKIIEVQQAFTDEPFTSLLDPTDGMVRAVKKVFTPVGVSFKGGGFYKTDSRNGSSSSSATPATATAASNGDSTSTPTSPSATDTTTSPPASSASAGTPTSKPEPASTTPSP